MTSPESPTGPFEALLLLPASLDAASTARAFVREHRDHLPTELVDEAQLLVSELVTNGVRYGRGALTLRLRVTPPGIGVAVHDLGEELPSTDAVRPNDTQASGRGLLIVDALATSWGVEPNDPPPGKTVWFELAAE